MTKSRGVLLILVVAAGLWAITLATWQAGASSETLGPAGVAMPGQAETTQASPVATACVAIIAVCGLLSAMFGRIGRFVIFGLAELAALGYGMSAITAIGAPGATSWPIVALLAAVVAVIVIGWVAYASRTWTGSNRYARSAEGAGGEFDSAATWDALSRGDEVETGREGTDAEAAEAESADAQSAEAQPSDAQAAEDESPRSDEGPTNRRSS